MRNIVVSTKFGYEFKYVRRKCSKPTVVIVEGRTAVIVDEASTEEAPIAYRILSVEGEPFEIRACDGRWWWPALAPSGRPLLSRTFVDGLERGIGYALSLLTPEMIGAFGSLPLPTAMETCNSLFVRSFDASEKEHLVRAANAGAADIMFCNDIVYVAGGPPVYCVHESGSPERPTSVISVVDGGCRPDGPMHPGRFEDDVATLQRQALVGLMFGNHEFEKAIEVAQQSGSAPVIRANIETFRAGTSVRGSADFRLESVYALVSGFLATRDPVAEAIARALRRHFPELVAPLVLLLPGDHGIRKMATVTAFVELAEAASITSPEMDQVYLWAKNLCRASMQANRFEPEVAERTIQSRDDEALMAYFFN